MLVARSRVKEIVRECDGINNVSDEFVERLEKKVQEVIQEACRRAKENGRKTVMGKDV